MLKKENILLVDDDINILELLQRHLHSLQYHSFKAASVKEALSILKDANIDLLITDIQMPEVDGLQLLQYCNDHHPSMPKLVVTGFPSVEGALKVIREGATDYISKPFTKEELYKAVQKALEQSEKTKKVGIATQPVSINSYGDMIGKSASFRRVTDIIDRVKDNKATVLINGESGTGKELVARSIHYTGKFSRAPFIAVNCSAIPENLQEAEFFGYVKGAFTGADENRKGFFQAANGGTLFLDEIGTASLAVQTKLLRALQEKEVTQIGSRKTEKVDIRIIAATNLDLRAAIKAGKFREDLYYRLTVVEIDVPALRDRKSDIPLLVEKFLYKYGVEYKDRLLRISSEALRILESYDWPGNIRELENIIQRAVIMSDRLVDVEHLPENIKFKINFAEGSLLPLSEMVRNYCQQVLIHTDQNISKAAEILQIDRKTLREKVK